MKKSLKFLPLVTLLALTGCVGKTDTFTVKPKDGTKVDAEEALTKLEDSITALTKFDAIGVDVDKLKVNVNLNQYAEIEEEKAEKIVGAKIDVNNVTLKGGLVNLSDADEHPENIQGAFDFAANSVKIDADIMNEETAKLENHKVNGKGGIHAYVDDTNIYFNVDEDCGKLVNDVAAVAGEELDIEFPIKTYFENVVSGFDLDIEEGQFLDSYNELTSDQQAAFLFQKYSNTSYSIYCNYQGTNDKYDEETEYLLKRDTIGLEAAIEFDVEKGLSRAAFIVSYETVQTFAYDYVDYEEYSKEFLEKPQQEVKIQAQGEAKFKYNDKVKVNLPNDLDQYEKFTLNLSFGD